jgi:hypothetical protein
MPSVPDEPALGKQRRQRPVRRRLAGVERLAHGAEYLAQTHRLGAANGEREHHLLPAQPQEPARSGDGAQDAARIRDVPVFRSLPEVRTDERARSAGDLRANGVSGEDVASARVDLLADGQRGRDDRRRGMNAAAVVGIVVVLEVAEVAVGESRVLSRGAESFAQHRGDRVSALSAEHIQQHVDGMVKRRIEGDRAEVHDAPLGKVHDPSGMSVVG